jgi:hypothetical protein
MSRRRHAFGVFALCALSALPAAAQQPTPAAAPPPATEPEPAPVAPAADPAPADPAPAAAAAPAAPAPAPTAAPAAPPASAGTLQSPDQLSTRNSAYSVPQGTWAFDAGALGIGGGDVIAALGATYGIGAGFQASVNLAHVSVGLFNASVHWQFIDTRYFALGGGPGIWFGHGSWIWFAQGVTKEILSKLDLVNVPIELTASSLPTTWLELDLTLQYTYSKLLGADSVDRAFFSDAQLDLNQFFVRPGARFFISDNTAFEFFAKLPAYSGVSGDRVDATVPFSKTWTLEAGLRSRLARGLFVSMRTHYAAVADVLYGARLYPSFAIEFRP